MPISEIRLVTEGQLFDFLKNLHYIEQLKNEDMSILLDRIFRYNGGIVVKKWSKF